MPAVLVVPVVLRVSAVRDSPRVLPVMPVMAVRAGSGEPVGMPALVRQAVQVSAANGAPLVARAGPVAPVALRVQVTVESRASAERVVPVASVALVERGVLARIPQRLV